MPTHNIKDWQIKLARAILFTPPNEWGDDTEKAIAGLIGEISGGSGLAEEVAFHPGQVILSSMPRDGPIHPVKVSSHRHKRIRKPNRGALWLYTTDLDCDRLIEVEGQKRIVTYLGDWAAFTDSPYAIVDLHHRLAVFPPTHRPAQLAWRFFRQFLGNAWPVLPEECILFCNACHDSYMVKIPRVQSLPAVWVYDKNSAYGDYLQRFPDLSKGRFVRTDRYLGPLGVYDTAQGFRSGFWIASNDAGSTVSNGWAWEGDWFASSPFRRFAEFCYSWTGPLRPLVKRFPALVVGKTGSHSYDRHTRTLLSRPTYYPIIWINVIGGLQAEMQQIAKRERAHHAFIDSIHLSHEATTLDIGDAIGQWRLVSQGPGEYDGLNRYHVGSIYRHQGIPSA